jgi:hypothetical protein
MRDAIGPMPRDLEQIGGDYGDFIVAMFERLCTDDDTIAIEDQKAFEARRAMKVRALENQLRSEGATENDIGAWATKLHIADELG